MQFLIHACFPQSCGNLISRCILSISPKKGTFSSCDLELRPMTLNHELPRYGQDEPPCHISRSELISFEDCRANTHTDTHTAGRLQYLAHKLARSGRRSVLNQHHLLTHDSLEGWIRLVERAHSTDSKAASADLRGPLFGEADK